MMHLGMKRRVPRIGVALGILLTGGYLPPTMASGCDCININSWKTLSSVVQASLSVGALGTRPHILLCPFAINKLHEEPTLKLNQKIFLQCMKENKGDKCVISGIGAASNPSLGPMIEISADNVWLQGLTLTGARNGAIRVTEGILGAKIINMYSVRNSSPDDQEGSVVEAGWGSLVHIIDSEFLSNRGTALQNRGSMMVISTKFVDNVASPFFDSSSDSAELGSGVGGAVMNSDGGTLILQDSCLTGNRAEQDGPAIWDEGEGDVIEVGGTCASGNTVTGLGNNQDGERNCDGVYSQDQDSCVPYNSCGGGMCATNRS